MASPSMELPNTARRGAGPARWHCRGLLPLRSGIAGRAAATERHGRLGTREVLIPLVYWHESYTAGLRDRLAGRAIPLPAGTFRERNARMVVAAAAIPTAELLRRWPANRRRLA
jgi:hypothetical protein